MDIGLAMSTHGLLTRDERDFFLQRLEADAMRPVQLAQLAERLGYHSLWFSDHVCMGRDLGAKHTANESGTRAYPDQPVMLDDALIGHQAMELPPVCAGGVHAQHVLP